MNKINRKLVKSQAKQIIKNKVFYLFLISIIVSVLTNGINVSTNIADGYNYLDDNDFDYNGDYFGNVEDYDDYSDFFYDFGDGFEGGSSDNPIEDYGNSSDNPIENFEGTQPQSFKGNISPQASLMSALTGGLSFLGIIGFALSALSVTLEGFYVSIARRRPEEEFSLGSQLRGVFKNTFNSTYIDKLVIYLLRNLFGVLLCILFIIPGIVYSYSTYFAYQLLCDYPNLKPTEALKLSKKIVKGNRGELFVLDLSFIGWGLLCAITFGLATIYVIPYYNATRALYYENFRLRALAEGRVNEDDFLSAEELMRKYNPQNGGASNTYYNPPQPNQNPYAHAGNNGQGYYYNPPTTANQTAQPNYNAQNAYNPQGNYTPQGAYYTPTKQETNAQSGFGYNPANTYAAPNQQATGEPSGYNPAILTAHQTFKMKAARAIIHILRSPMPTPLSKPQIQQMTATLLSKPPILTTTATIIKAICHRRSNI